MAEGDLGLFGNISLNRSFSQFNIPQCNLNEACPGWQEQFFNQCILYDRAIFQTFNLLALMIILMIGFGILDKYFGHLVMIPYREFKISKFEFELGGYSMLSLVWKGAFVFLIVRTLRLWLDLKFFFRVI